MAARADLKTVISADMTGFSATMRKAGALAKNTGSAIGRSIGSATKAMGNLALSAGKAGIALGAVGAAVGGAALIRGLKSAADLGGAMSDLAARTGIAAGDLAVMGRAFEDNGVSADKIGGIINKLQKTITDFGTGSATATKPFERLGISFDQIAKLNPAAQFQLIQSKVAALESPTDRAAVAMQLFGKSGGELLTLFADGQAFTGASKFLGTQAEILDRSSGIFDAISDKLARVPDKLQGFFVGFLEPIAGSVDSILTKFDNYDFAAIGQRISNGLVNLDMEKVTNIFVSLSDVITNAMIDGIGAAYNVTTKIFESLMIQGAIPNIAKELSKRLALAVLDVAQAQIDMLKRLAGFGDDQKDKVTDYGKIVSDAIKDTDFSQSKGTAEAFDRLREAMRKAFPQLNSGGTGGGGGNPPSPNPGQSGGQSPAAPGTSRRQDDGTTFGPSKDLMTPQIFGPSKDLMSEEAKIAKWLDKKQAKQLGDGFKGLAERTGMQASMFRGNAPGSDNVFSKDRERLGLGSGLGGGMGRWSGRQGIGDASVTGGLGEKRRLRTSADDKGAKKNLSIQEKQVEFLESIEGKIADSLKVN